MGVGVRLVCVVGRRGGGVKSRGGVFMLCQLTCGGVLGQDVGHGWRVRQSGSGMSVSLDPPSLWKEERRERDGPMACHGDKYLTLIHPSAVTQSHRHSPSYPSYPRRSGPPSQISIHPVTHSALSISLRLAQLYVSQLVVTVSVPRTPSFIAPGLSHWQHPRTRVIIIVYVSASHQQHRSSTNRANTPARQ